MFRTLNFRDKRAAIAWMLSLALALVLIDYYAGPVSTSRGWHKEVLWSQIGPVSALYFEPQKGLYVLLEEQKKDKNEPKPKLLFYNPLNSEKKQLTETQKIALLQSIQNNNSVTVLTPLSQIMLEKSQRQGRLILHRQDEQEIIVRNLHNPTFLVKGDKNELYLVEQGRDRILKISHAE